MHPDNANKIVSVLKAFGFNHPELNENLFLHENKILRMGVRPYGWKLPHPFQVFNLTNVIRRGLLTYWMVLKLT